jgi:hypothetical protein
MPNPRDREWRKIAKGIQTERNPEQLSKLVTELCESLDRAYPSAAQGSPLMPKGSPSNDGKEGNERQAERKREVPEKK